MPHSWNKQALWQRPSALCALSDGPLVSANRRRTLAARQGDPELDAVIFDVGAAAPVFHAQSSRIRNLLGWKRDEVLPPTKLLLAFAES